ncbi:40387_t:CDS:1 [Gigaspora margarita]|uniref:40387_t:CDS:1 n=1 Tax=Gigaspora margarita TaxID=4874 RepID=A0ABN7VW74_GIGMA|nr:40387_t:CDS:1 [Gigaspora margarita]
MQSEKGEITISYNNIIENYSIISLDEKYMNGRNFEIKVYHFLKCKEYHMTLSDSCPINSNFRFFNLSDRLALQIGNYRITGDGGLDIIGNKNGMQIIVQAKFSKTGKYPNLKKAYKEFINTVETRKSTNEFGIFVVTNNIKIQELKNIISTERKIIICHFNELEGYIKQIEQEHIIRMLKLSNEIYNAKDCIEDSNLTIKDLKNKLTILMSHLEKFGDIKNILACNTKNIITIILKI